MPDITTLQPGSGRIPAPHYVPTEPGTFRWGRLPNHTDAPVLKVSSGDEVTIDTVSHEGLLEDQGRDPVAFFGAHGVDRSDVLSDAITIARGGVRNTTQDGPHIVTGPIEIDGAQPGDLLTMTIVETTPRVGYGVISNRHGQGALSGEFPRGAENISVFADVATGSDDNTLFGRLPLAEGAERTVRFPLAPFLGIMGVATPGPRLHSVPPGAHGGNIDINLLQAGASLHLPVQVPGALAYVGDPHFAQGDGEVALTAMEASLRATIRFDLIAATDAAERFGELAGPIAETQDFLIPTGMDEDLDEAVRECVRHAIAILGARWGMREQLAYAYLSAATDFNISQVVDVVTGVHARIRKSDFAGASR